MIWMMTIRHSNGLPDLSQKQIHREVLAERGLHAARAIVTARKTWVNSPNPS